MPAMTSSTGITLRACSALSRKQLIFFIGFLFLSSPFTFFCTPTHTHTLLLSFSFNDFVEGEKKQKRSKRRRTGMASSSFFYFAPLFCCFKLLPAAPTQPSLSTPFG